MEFKVKFWNQKTDKYKTYNVAGSDKSDAKDIAKEYLEMDCERENLPNGSNVVSDWSYMEAIPEYGFGSMIKKYGKVALEKGKEKGKELGAKAVEKSKEYAQKGLEKGKEYAKKGAEKGKEYAKKGFEKSKEYAKEKVKDAQKGVVKKVINETRTRASVSDKEAFTLKSASQIIDKKFKTGGKTPYQPPLFAKGTKYTLSQVDSIIYNALIKRFKVDATMLAGRKMVFKNKKNSLTAEIYLDTVGVSGEYAGLRIQIINSATQEKGNSSLIKLSDIKYGDVPNHYKGNINKGGYYWDYDKEFYAYVPDFNLILDDVEQYLAMMDVVQSRKYKCGGNMALGGNTAKRFEYGIGGL